ncbi:MAG: TIGR03768 family metallophosphoesterase [Sedimentisphaerales bacterium]|jgi:metallophosphoesterase (TIGR03768 family)
MEGKTMKRRVAIVFMLSLAATVQAVAQTPKAPSYPIATDIHTTLDETVIATTPLAVTPALDPCDIPEYATYQYGEWDFNLGGFPFIRPDPNMQSNNFVLSVADPLAATLLSFFSISDVHIADKESPAQAIYPGYRFPEPCTPGPNGLPVGNSSCYSGIILYTTHVLDAAVQTINALHEKTPFDFGIALGDAVDNTQYNELRWYIDVLDGKMITPSSGSHIGAKTIDYQKRYQAAGLNKSIPWYQAIGNHDQFWKGSTKVTDYLRKAYVGSRVLNTGPIISMPPDFNTILSQRGLYMGVVDGSTEFGDIIDAGPVENFSKPPKVTADGRRRSLTVKNWMRQFFNTTSKPVGHGFTKQMAKDEFVCYHFYPRADVPIKVIVLDDTDKVGGGAAAALDAKRYNWLVKELDDGESAGELMIICSHIPLRPYATPQNPPPSNNPLYPLWSLWTPYSEISENTLLAKLHTYKNLILWMSGHVHRNAITPQPDPNGNPEYGFWEVETPSLRDFPQQFRRFEIVRNSDNNISIFALDVDPAVNPDRSASPARTSRSYAIAAQQIFQNVVKQGPNIDPCSGVYNAELVKQLSPAMQAKIALISPAVSSFSIDDNARSTTSSTVTLNNTITGSTPTRYMASESADFSGAAWLPYSTTPSFTMSSVSGTKTVYFKVKDGSENESEIAHDSIVLKH